MRRLTAVFFVSASACQLGYELKPARSSHQQLGALTVADPGACALPPPAPAQHEGLCVCDTLEAVGTVRVKKGRDGTAARLGVNGTGDVVGDVAVEGDATFYRALAGTGEVRIDGTLWCAGDVDGVGRLSVGKDLLVGGNLANVGELEVEGALALAGEQSAVGDAKVGGLASYAAPALPCDCQAALDVKALVDDARTHNDNAALGIPTLDVVGTYDLALPTGRYYFGRVSTVGDTVIHVNGAVALYLDGDLEQVGTGNLMLEPGSTLDLYLSGNLSAVGESTFASAAQGAAPGQLRIFVAGAHEISAVGAATWVGSLYAPGSSLELVGEASVSGAVLVKRLDGVGDLTLEAAAQAAMNPQACELPEPTPQPAPGHGGPSCDAGLIEAPTPQPN